MRIWRHPPSLWHQHSKIRPSAWSVKTSSLSFAALWSTSTIGRKGRSENGEHISCCYSLFYHVVASLFVVFFSPHLMWCCVMFCPDRTVWMKKRTAVRDHHPSRRWDSHFSVLPHVSCRFRWWITGSQKAVGVFQRCCNFLQRRLCWSAVFVCVPSAPKGQGSLLPSNRRRTDKQQRFVSVDTVFTDFYIYCDNLLFYICFFPQVSKSRRHRQVEVDFTSNEAPTLGRSRITKPSLKARTSENLHISGNLPVTTKNTTFPDLKHFTPVPALCAIPGLGHDIDKQEGLSLH